MNDELRARTAPVNGKLWGAKARDWADCQEHTVRAVFAEVMARTGVGASTRYLDAGCGSGMAAAMAADLGADVCGIDASDAMLEIARERTPAGDFITADLEDIPFESNDFDVVTGFNSFQYAGNPVVALGEARRLVRTDGQVVVMTWGLPDGMEAGKLVGALKPLLPPPPPGAPGPFALSEEAVLRGFAVEAGLTPVDVFDVDSPWVYDDMAMAVRGIMSTGIVMRALDFASAAQIEAAYVAVLERFAQADGSLHIGATYRCLLARP